MIFTGATDATPALNAPNIGESVHNDSGTIQMYQIVEVDTGHPNFYLRLSVVEFLTIHKFGHLSTLMGHTMANQLL